MPTSHRCFFLITDFGTQDAYVGQMKASLAAHLDGPIPVFVDLCHEVPRGGIADAAWRLEASMPFLPRGSLVVAVVDPGVGTDRRGVACLSESGVYLTGPDNGLFGRIGIERAWLLPAPQTPQGSGMTFDGRDLFAIAAAMIAGMGDAYLLRLEPLDPSTLIRARIPEPLLTPDGLRCSVCSVDHFGNVILWLSPDRAGDLPGEHIRLPDGRIERFTHATTYGGEGGDGLLLIVGSQGRMELALDGGSAAETLDIEPGERILFIE